MNINFELSVVPIEFHHISCIMYICIHVYLILKALCDIKIALNLWLGSTYY